MKISKISKAEAEKEFTSKPVKGQYKQLIEQIKEEGGTVKVEELTRGQVAALYRTATAEGLKVRANYRDGYVVLSA